MCEQKQCITDTDLEECTRSDCGIARDEKGNNKMTKFRAYSESFVGKNKVLSTKFGTIKAESITEAVKKIADNKGWFISSTVAFKPICIEKVDD